MPGIKVIDAGGQEAREATSQEATEGFLQGRFAVQDESVLVGRGHDTGHVPAAELANAIADGWELISDDDAASRRLQKDETGAAGIAQGAVERAAAGATLGLSTLALEAIGVDPKRIKARAEGLGGYGEGIEIVSGLLAGGIGGLGRKAGQEAAEFGARQLIPAAAAEFAGEAAERVGRKLLGEAAETGIARVAQRALPVGARGAVEGFMYGVGAEIDESVMGERGIAVDRLMASGALSAALGGVSELGLRVGIPSIVSGSKKVSAGAIEGVLGAASGAKGSEKLARQIAKAQAIVSSAPAESLENLWRRVLRQDPDVARVMSREGVADVNDEIAGVLKTSIDDLIPSYRETRQIVSSGKLGKVDNLMPSDAGTRMRATMESAQVLDDMTAQISALRSRADEFGDMHRGILQKSEKIMERVAHDLEAGPGGAASMFRALDDAKRSLDDVLAPARKSAKRTGDMVAAETLEQVSAVAGRARKFLMDEEIWGAAGTFQRELNEAISGTFRAVDDSDKLVGRIFRGDAVEMDPGSALGIVRRYGRDIKGAKMGNDLEEVLHAQERIFGVAEKYFDLDAGAAAKIKAARETRERVTRALEEKAELAAIADDWTRIRSAEGGGSPSLTAMSTMGPTVGSALGLGIGGLPGAAIGGIAGGITRPYTTLRTFAALQDMARKMDIKTGTAIDDFLGGTGASVGAGALPGMIDKAATARRAARLGAAQAVAKRPAESAEERHQRLKEALPALAQNPGKLVSSMEPYTWSMKGRADGLASGMLATAANAARFLASKLPTTYTPALGAAELVDPIALAKFDRYAEAVENPVEILEKLGAGTLTQEHTEAIREVYPALYQDVQTRVMNSIAQAAADNRPISFNKRITLGILLNAPTDQSLQPFALRSIQAVHASTVDPAEALRNRPSKVKSGADVNFAGRAETQADRVERGLEG